MNDIQELIEAVRDSGATIRAERSDLKIKPAGVILPDLKVRLKEHKAQILKHLELEASMKRWEAAGIHIAVWEDGSMRVLVSEANAKAVNDGGTVYSPRDMFMFVSLSYRERRMLHEFKRRFGGTVEWKEKLGGVR